MFVHGGPLAIKRWKEGVADLMGSEPEIQNNLEFTDLTREEQQEEMWKRVKLMYERHNDTHFKNYTIQQWPQIDWYSYFQGLLPISLSMSMFKVSFENLASEE